MIDRDELLTLLEHADGPLTAQEIGRALDEQPQVVKYVLHILAQGGAVDETVVPNGKPGPDPKGYSRQAE